MDHIFPFHLLLVHVNLEQAYRIVTVHHLTRHLHNQKDGVFTHQSSSPTSSSTIPQVLHCCVSGSNLHTQQSHYLLSLSDLSNDYDLLLGQVKSFEPSPSQTTTDFGNLLTVAEGKIMEPS